MLSKAPITLIDMGPEGGRNVRGNVLFTGTPEDISVRAETKSYTAPFLKDELNIANKKK